MRRFYGAGFSLLRRLMTYVDDFGTGLRAHLGLDTARLDLAADPAAPVQPRPAPRPDEPEAEAPDAAALEALAVLEADLLERERALQEREATLASRAGSLLAAAQALYDDVMAGATTRLDDELTRLRERKEER
jgi:hypothetical protein